jgi:hypothetical protein
MQRLHVLCGFLAVTALATGLEAQVTDWEALRQLPAGTKIKIKLKHKPTFGHCVLEEVADGHLDCFYGPLGSRTYAREDIRQVMLGRHSARTGFFVGAGVGAALGAGRGCCDATGRGLMVLIVAPLVGGIGAGFGALADPMIDGKTVYRSPDPKSQPQSDKTQVITSAELPGPKSLNPEVTMNYRTLCCLLSLALPVGMHAQSESSFQTATPETVAARCQYTPTDPACTTAVPRDTDSLAQARGRMRPMPPRRFGLGAAIGAKGNTDQHPGVGVKAAFAFGTIGGLLGAAVGATVPSFQARNLRRHGPWPHDPEPDELASNQPGSTEAR